MLFFQPEHAMPMNKRKIFDFLRDLQANNSKEWMDENRDRYEEAKEIWCDEIQLYLNRLSKFNMQFSHLKPKQTIMRINNNLLYKPNAPVYKDYFAFDPKKGKNRTSFYLHISPNGSFIAGGLYHPSNDLLKKVRAAIDYNGEEFLKIVSAKPFQTYFGGLAPDEDQLVTAPQGYSQEHKHIELLRRKNFTVIRDVTQKEVLDQDFVDEVEKAFAIMLPMNSYLDKALKFEASPASTL